MSEKYMFYGAGYIGALGDKLFVIVNDDNQLVVKGC